MLPAFGADVIVYIPELVIFVGKEVWSGSLLPQCCALIKKCFVVSSRGDVMEIAAGICNK